jgi:hypothetical protein
VNAFHLLAVGGTASSKMTPNDLTVTGFVQLYEAEMCLWQRPDRNYKNKNCRKAVLLRMFVLYKEADLTQQVKYSLRLLSGIINNSQQRKK